VRETGSEDTPAQRREIVRGVPFRSAARFWIKLGFINFGGPTGQIAIMHEELVDRLRWIDEDHFLHALNYCVLLPGPEAQQLAIYVGWLLHKVKGGLVAGIGFIAPAFFLMLVLSWTYAAHGDIRAVGGVFDGLQAAVVGIITAALIRIGTRALRGPFLVGVAAAAFLSIFLFHLAFPIMILGSGLLGAVVGRIRPGLVRTPAAPAADDIVVTSAPPTARRSLIVLVIGLAAWLGPLIIVSALPGTPEVIGQQAAFFSKAALVTFGGAYAVLAYINQAAVLQYGWLLPGQMIAGLGLAESTPGPLIMVTEFVGFLGAYQNPGTLSPTAAGILGAAVTTWATFAPCFLWIFLGAPYVERLRGNRTLAASLSTITAAVVGTIASLAVTFGIHVLFNRVHTVTVFGGPIPVPTVTSLDWFALIVAAAGFVALTRFKVNVLWVIAASAVAGVIRALA
jgi:chromate transporter